MTRGSEGLSAHILPSRPSQQATTPAAAGGLNDAAPKEETGILAQAEGEEAASPIPAGKEVAEEVAVAGTSGWEVRQPGPSRGPTEKPRVLWGEWGGSGEGRRCWG